MSLVSDLTFPSPAYLSTLPRTGGPIDLAAVSCIRFSPCTVLRTPSIPVPPVGCSTEKCNILLVVTDILFHFRSIILFKSKCPQIHWNKIKIKWVKISASLIFPYVAFFILMKLLVTFVSHKTTLIATTPLLFFSDWWLNIFDTN